jgi:hypothetical protein
MIVSLEGEEASGKTTFAYTAPLKVVGFSFDLGTRRALYGAKAALFEGLKVEIIRYAPGAKPELGWANNDITVYEMPRPVQIDNIRITGCKELWAYFLQLFVMALKDPLVRSLAVDTMTLARRVRVDSHLEALQDATTQGQKMRERLLQIEYGNPNDATRDLYNACQALEKNLVATHHLTDEYVEERNAKGEKEQSKTGRRLLEGLSGTYRCVDVALRVAVKDGEVMATVNKCGYNLDQLGATLKNPTWNSLANFIMMGLGDRIQIERRNHD